MSKCKYKICQCCNQEFPATREYFKRRLNKSTGKEELLDICRSCEKQSIVKDNWKDGKLKCHICGEWLDPEKFDSHPEYKYRNHKDKRCKKCKAIQNKEARQKYSEDDRLYKLIQERWLTARSRATRKNIPFTITKEDIIDLWKHQEGKCAISRIPMTFEIDNGRIFTNLSLDQKIPGQGYTKENIQLVCQAVNQLKSDWDMDTVLYLCQAIVSNYK